MRKIIREKLEKTEDLKERKILKNIIVGSFEGIVDYQEMIKRDIEGRVFNDMKNDESNYNIYTTLIKRDQVDILDENLFPLLESDREVEEGDILEKIENREEAIIEKVFLMLDYNEITKLIREQRTFSGKIKCGDKSYEIAVRLDYNRDYLEVEERLYYDFLNNSLSWRTVYSPFARRFFNVVIVDYLDATQELGGYEEVEYNLEEYEEVKYIDYIPAWNIKKILEKGEGFPLPSEDKVTYEHFLTINNINPDNGYMVMSDKNEILSVRRDESDLIINSKESRPVPWDILEFVQSDRIFNQNLDFDLVENSKNDSFTNRFIYRRGGNINTVAEIKRIIEGFKVARDVSVNNIKILEDDTPRAITYDFNEYIKDEIRERSSKKIMFLEFEVDNQDYLTIDKISFLLSELQIYFPEYICKGALLE